MKKNLLTVVAAAAIAVSAQAQEGRLVEADRSYLFSSTTDADGTDTITYQWFRNGVEIPNATSEIYILPAHLAQGANVEFKRGARSPVCENNISYSNVFVVTFCKGLVVGSLCWATTNVDDYQTFAVRPDMYTKFYQWNRPAAWAATGSISGWNSTADQSSWTINPCPSGWRLPTPTEYTALNNTGSTWVEANTRGNAVAGRFFGANNASCTLPNNMYGCVFLPAVGYRNYSDGMESSRSNLGDYWSATESNSSIGYNLYFYSILSSSNAYNEKAYGFSIRCVQ